MELIITSKKYGTHSVYYDDEDHELISGYKWMITGGKKGVYYARGYKGKKKGGAGVYDKVRMHRLVMNANEDQEVDHIDHDGRNNKKSNLRFVTDSQNSANTRLHSDSRTGFKGVTFKKSKRLYLARIRYDGRLIYGGSFKNIYKAALRYNELAKKYFGGHAFLNILTEEQIRLAHEEMPPRIYNTNKTGYWGVSVSKKGGVKPYFATVVINRKSNHMGCFATPEEAAKAFNEGLIRLGGDLRKLNKIPE